MAGGSNPQNVQTPQSGGAGFSQYQSGPQLPGYQSNAPMLPGSFTAGNMTQTELRSAAMPQGQAQQLPAGFSFGSAAQPAAAPSTPTAAPAAPAITPATASTTGQPDVYQTSADLYNKAAAGPNISQFMNPYTSMVTDQAMQDLNRQRQMAINDTGLSATRAGAFGGSRHGVAEALTNTGYAQQGANMFANLQQQGFNTALNAAQNQQNIDSALAGQGFRFGQDIGNKQWEQGDYMRGLNQDLVNAIKGQFGGFTGQPTSSLDTLWKGITGSNMGQNTSTSTQKRGLFDYITALAGVFPS